MSPQEQLLASHLRSPDFQKGVDQGCWGLFDESEWPDNLWPYRLIWINCNAPGAEKKYVFRFDFTGYNHSAPTACCWDLHIHKPLIPQRRPQFDPVVKDIFKQYNQNSSLDGIYKAIDRNALICHPDWRNKYPQDVWQPGDHLMRFVNFLYDTLNPPKYEL